MCKLLKKSYMLSTRHGPFNQTTYNFIQLLFYIISWIVEFLISCTQTLNQFLKLVSGGFSDQKNQISNWKRLLRFRNLQEKLENVMCSTFFSPTYSCMDSQSDKGQVRLQKLIVIIAQSRFQCCICKMHHHFN